MPSTERDKSNVPQPSSVEFGVVISGDSDIEKRKEYTAKEYPAKVQEITGRDILVFGKQILLYLFILLVFVFSGTYITAAYFSQNSELIKLVYSILDFTKTAVPAIATLVIGFYFSKKDS
ncbi:MAG: hypothetical protein ACKN9T_09455 [Candidatus Methylumidiphilus sp.]